VQWLVAELRPGDLCLSLGAGDITAVATEVQAALDMADPPAPVRASTALQAAGPGA
jgi:hypothetical protein